MLPRRAPRVEDDSPAAAFCLRTPPLVEETAFSHQMLYLCLDRLAAAG